MRRRGQESVCARGSSSAKRVRFPAVFTRPPNSVDSKHDTQHTQRGTHVSVATQLAMARGLNVTAGIAESRGVTQGPGVYHLSHGGDRRALSVHVLFWTVALVGTESPFAAQEDVKRQPSYETPKTLHAPRTPALRPGRASARHGKERPSAVPCSGRTLR